MSGNGWQGVSVATWGNYSPLGTSGIVFAGTNSFVDPFQLEMGDFNNPGFPPAGDAIITYSTNIGDGADVTVQASDYGFAVHEGSTLAQELSQHIRELKSSGIYFRLLEKYLGTEAVEMVQAARE